MEDVEYRVRHLYMYYLKEQVTDKAHIMNNILDDIGNTIENVKLIQSIFKEDATDLTEDQKELLSHAAKELEEQGYFDEDSYVVILEDALDQNIKFSVKKAFDYLEHLKYDTDSELYDDLDDTEVFESYIKEV